jgi:hypothetical protein
MTLMLAFTGRHKTAQVSIGQRLLSALTFPGYLAIAVSGLSLKQFYFRPGVALHLEKHDARRGWVGIRRPAMIGAIGGVVAFLAVAIMTAISLAKIPHAVLAITGAVFTAALMVAAASLVASIIAMFLLGSPQTAERKAAGWTKSKRSPIHTISPPPVPPSWTIGFLAADPRVAAPGAFHAAQDTLRDLIKAGDVVETVAATPRLARLYERAGFQRWHPASLAMWRIY